MKAILLVLVICFSGLAFAQDESVEKFEDRAHESPLSSFKKDAVAESGKLRSEEASEHFQSIKVPSSNEVMTGINVCQSKKIDSEEAEKAIMAADTLTEEMRITNDGKFAFYEAKVSDASKSAKVIAYTKCSRLAVAGSGAKKIFGFGQYVCEKSAPADGFNDSVSDHCKPNASYMNWLMLNKRALKDCSLSGSFATCKVVDAPAATPASAPEKPQGNTDAAPAPQVEKKEWPNQNESFLSTTEPNLIPIYEKINSEIREYLLTLAQGNSRDVIIHKLTLNLKSGELDFSAEVFSRQKAKTKIFGKTVEENISYGKNSIDRKFDARTKAKAGERRIKWSWVVGDDTYLDLDKIAEIVFKHRPMYRSATMPE